MDTDKIILGIDPGTSVMGYGLVAVSKGKTEMINMGVIRLNKLDSHEERLSRIFSRVSGIISEFGPHQMAIEAPFYGKNVQSMLKLGKAQGVAIAAALNANIPYFEYAPRRIKQSITGKGGASKEQVAAMLKNILNIKELPKDLDATDGLAAALCHHYSTRGLNSQNKTYSGWSAFVKQQEKRIIQK
ncbi:MAG: crossover junction endodeoxyribonuclease RuvC [Bacteroidota bacterium]